MDAKSKENFDRIVRTEPEALSQGDIEFLKARRSYLTASDRERYAEVLGIEPEQQAREESSTKKKGK